MRHLFLTSSGLTKEMQETFFEVIGKKPEKTRVLYIPTAGIESDDAREGFAICLYELAKMGVRSENIMVYNLELLLSKGYERTYSAYVEKEDILSRLITEEEMKAFDAIFISGGNTGVLCREMERTGFDNVLKKAVNAGVVYVGISAGSVCMAANLSNGLHIIPNAIIPHWYGEKSTEIPENGGEIRLADGQAVYISGEDISII